MVDTRWSELKKDQEATAAMVGGLVDRLGVISQFGYAFPKEPMAILERKMVKRGDRAATQVLIQWRGSTAEDATWEFLHDLQKRYPWVTLEDKCFLRRAA